MSRLWMVGMVLGVVCATGAQAEAPRVVTDIPPVHALAAQVMAGVGSPDLILQPGASPHGSSLRPSQAAALQSADVVIWIGPGLTPWLDGAVDALSPTSLVVTLTNVSGTLELPYRETALFAEEDHAHDEDHDGDHKHHNDHDHDHGEFDPHAWLSPDNAALWLTAIAEALAQADPAQADLYRANAVDGVAQIDALRDQIAAQLAPVRGRGFVVFHDAYQYFEHTFGIPALGAISLSDATPPSPARLVEIRDGIAQSGARCVLAEPQFDPRLVATVAEGQPLKTGVLDPLGSAFAPGPDLYADMMRGLAQALADCLAD